MAVLRVRNGPHSGTLHPVPDSSRPILIGRDPGATIVLADDRASRRHASLRRSRGAWVLRDLGSRNRTRVSGRPVLHSEIDDGTVIRIGGTELVFEAETHAPPPLAEVHGAKLEHVIQEEAGVLTCVAFQAALDRRVRVDLLSTSEALDERGEGWLATAIEDSRTVVHPALDPVLQSSVDRSGVWVLARDRGSETLDRAWARLLAEPVSVRIAIFSLLAEGILARATHESLRFLIAPRRVALGQTTDGFAFVSLPLVDLPALVSEASGDWAHLPWYAPYVAPERIRRPPDAAPGHTPRTSIVYELAALGYHFLTGSPPMGPGSHRDILARHGKHLPLRANEAVPDVLPEIGRILEACLAADPADRPANTAEILGVFSNGKSALRSSGFAASPPPMSVSAPGPEVVAARTPPPAATSALPSTALQRVPVSGRPAALPLWMIVWILAFFLARFATLWLIEGE